MYEVKEFATYRGQVRTVDIAQEDLPVGAIIANEGVVIEGELGVQLLQVTAACEEHPRGWLFVEDLDPAEDDEGGFFAYQYGHVFHRVVEAEDEDLAALVEAS